MGHEVLVSHITFTYRHNQYDSCGVKSGLSLDKHESACQLREQLLLLGASNCRPPRHYPHAEPADHLA